MTEEEKKAIDRLFHLAHINTYVDLNTEHNIEISSLKLKEWQNDTKILLNLIEKKDKVIDLMAEKLSERSEWYTAERWKEICYKQVEVEDE